ncbi:MAG: adenylate/guanylate cyclase domain-containing protein [Rhodospirillales bacterium]
MTDIIRGKSETDDPLAPLIGQMGGWDVSSVARWFVTEGQRIADPKALVNGLFRRLEAVRAPVWRVRLSIRTINPTVFGHGVVWQRDRPGVEEWAVGHAITESDDYIGSPIQWVHQNGRMFRQHLTQLTTCDHSVLHGVRSQGGYDYMALPFVFTDGQVNVLTIATDRVEGFSDRDIAKFEALLILITPSLEAMAVRRVARTLLDTYVGPRTGERVLNGRFRRGDADEIEAALWFSDLRGFTAMTEALSSRDMLATLNTYFEQVAAATTARGGEILRFIGDAMLIVFPVAQMGCMTTACQSALDSALDAFNVLATVNLMRRRHGEPEIIFGVGLHAGTVVYGNVGSPDRLDFTVMGPAVNRTARLEGLTKTLGTPLLMSADVAARVCQKTVDLGRHSVKGIAEPVDVFGLCEPPLGVKPSCPAAKS